MPDGAAELSGAVERIVRLVAVFSNQHVGDTLLLLTELDDGSQLQVTEPDGGWPGLLTALDHSGRIASSSTIWMLQVVGDPTHTPLILIDQASGQP